MNKFMTKKWFAGIDISMETIDVCLLDGTTAKKVKEKKFKNDFTGFDQMNCWLEESNLQLYDVLFCMEHTGTYGLLLFLWMEQHNADYCVEPGIQIKKSIGIARGKNDRVDAHRIASYAFEKQTSLVPYKLPGKNLVELKQLMTYRDQLVRIRTGFKNSFKSHQQYAIITKSTLVVNDIESKIKLLSQSIDSVEIEMKKLIADDPELRQNFQMATSVIGIGLIIAAYMLVSTTNFTSFQNGRQYACYSGTAPFAESSGSWNGKAKVHPIADRKIKTLLANGANAARKWDPEIKRYYDRKTQEGKPHKLIINSICCKLTNRVFAVVSRKTPYAKIYKNNFV